MRIDPLTPDEFKKLLTAIEPEINARFWNNESYKDRAKLSYKVILRTLWFTGCHPSVLTRDAKTQEMHGPWLKHKPDGWVMQWKRPKTRNICIMPVPDDLVDDLKKYLENPYKRQNIWKVIRALGKRSGVEDPSPLLIRHTVGLTVWKSAGPDAAKRSLAVGNKAIEHYTALTPGKRLQEVKEALWNR